MRPVERGDLPIDPNTGIPIVFTQYSQAKSHLIDRVGEYCSYCERSINHLLHVEHIQPKAARPDLERRWDNFLLSCVNCNAAKGHEELILRGASRFGNTIPKSNDISSVSAP